ncbi:MAG TPA: hypothetical protein PKM21_06765 [Anaerolineales bacterium]|nr:hypothetical protein [Anaerolineales bacterium]
MKNNDLLTKILAAAGTALVWIPVLLPVVFWLGGLVRRGRGNFDFLIPAELSPLVIIGGGLLLWAALRVHTQVKLIAWSLGIGVVMLVASQLLAVVTGLASGETAMGGWQWALVLAGLVIYTLAVIALGIDGIRLLQYLFKSKQA